MVIQIQMARQSSIVFQVPGAMHRGTMSGVESAWDSVEFNDSFNLRK
jgi:hypothetical protein